MAAVVKMPKLSDTMEEGAIASWLKKEGDSVAEGEPLVEIETDKATMEFVSPESGVLLKIIVPNGGSASLQAPIAVVGKKGEGFDLESLISAAGKGGGSSHKSSPPAPKQESSVQREPSESRKESATHKESSAPAQRSEAAVASIQQQATGRIKASPLARKMAEQKGVDIGAIAGSGPGGRIVAADIAGGAASAGRLASSSVKGSRRADQKLPLTMMRKTIAKRLLAGKNDAPHFYLTVTAQMDETWKWREQLNSDVRVVAGELTKVSINDIILMICAKALMKHPGVNSSWQEDSILQYGNADVCMAVALPTGLVTPVIRNCDQLGVREISQEAKRLGLKARNNELKPEDYTGGTFTVSNLGMTRVEHFTAIINPPQSCILAVGTITQQPAVSAAGQIVAQRQMKMTLSCDHRVVDGMLGARFLETVLSYLENPIMMLE